MNALIIVVTGLCVLSVAANSYMADQKDKAASIVGLIGVAICGACVIGIAWLKMGP